MALALTVSVGLLVWSVTMVLTAKDRKIAALLQWGHKVENQNKEFLTSLLACVNGEGFVMEFTPNTSTRVKCTIEEEWISGVPYKKEDGRIKRKFR
jgi:hypothetical protein